MYSPRLRVMVKKRFDTSILRSSVYSYNPNKKFKFIQKMIFKFLDRIGCQWYENIVDFKYVDVDISEFSLSNKFIKSLYSYEEYNNFKPNLIVVGHTEFIDLKYQLKENYLGVIDNTKIMGIRTIIDPNIDGFIFLKV